MSILSGLKTKISSSRLAAKARQSILWLKIKLKSTGFKEVTKPVGGKMYLCIYDAKYKDTLPIWDAAPLTMFWKADAKHIYGLNFHYLTPDVRTKLLNALNKASGKRKYPQIAAATLSAIAKQERFKPAVKMYLFSHFKSNLLEIPKEEWENIIYLPLAKFHRNRRK